MILIRLNKLNYIIPNSLKSILINQNIIRYGIEMHQDITKIHRDFDIKIVGFIELNVLYKLPSFCNKQIIKNKSSKHLYSICCHDKILEK